VLVTQPFGSRAASTRGKRRVSLECYDEASFRWLGVATQPSTIFGHEFCGIVEEVGANVTRFKRGDRVAIPFNHSCGSCEECQAGQNVCLDLRMPMLHYMGGFGRYAKVTYAEINLVAWQEAKDA
jgi:threonine dehydrogenase-like Zn-dependent dehydrogenase